MKKFLDHYEWVFIAFLLFLYGCFQGVKALTNVLCFLIPFFSPALIIYSYVFYTRKYAVLKSLTVCAIYMLWVYVSDSNISDNLKISLVGFVIFGLLYLLIYIYSSFFK